MESGLIRRLAPRLGIAEPDVLRWVWLCTPQRALDSPQASPESFLQVGRRWSEGEWGRRSWVGLGPIAGKTSQR